MKEMKRELRDSINDALSRSAVSFLEDKEEVILLTGEQLSISNQIKSIERLVKKISASEGELFSMGESRILCSSIGRRVLRSLKAPLMARAMYPIHDFNPYCTIFMDNVERMKIDRYSNTKEFYGNEAEEVVKKLNDFVQSIRGESNSKEFLVRMNSYHRASNKNYRELKSYIDCLFEKYSRLLIVRIDLSYFKGFSQSSPDRGYSLVRRHRKRLFRNARYNALFKERVGYAWKLEYGAEKGFHYHVLLFFNGASRFSDVWIAKEIGEYWKNVVTDGEGLYFNCNARKGAYRSCGIGMVHYGDKDARRGLDDLSVYLTKVDYYLKLALPGSDRSFGKGNKSIQPTKKSGRPRTVL